MPLNTRDKRASAIGIGSPSRVLLPVPDPQAEDQGDRQQVDFAYRGILAIASLIVSARGGASPIRIYGGAAPAFLRGGDSGGERAYGGSSIRGSGGSSPERTTGGAVP